MRNTDVLKTGIVGYIYRWLRNAGVVAVVSGGGLLAVDTYHARMDVPVEATVTTLEIECTVTGNSKLTQVYQKAVECSDAARIVAANPKLPLAVREITYARLSYHSASGIPHVARLAADALGRPDIQRGETIAILSDRTDPSLARPIAPATQNRRNALLMGVGLLMLLLVWLARKAADYQSDVAAEVATLERNYRAASTARALPRTRALP